MQVLTEGPATTSPTPPVMPVPLAELSSAEWVQLTWGLFWRSIVWALVASVIGSVLSIAIAVAVNMVLDGELHPTAYRWTATISTVVVTLLVTAVLFAWYARWTLSARYGRLRMVIVRDSADPRAAP